MTTTDPRLPVTVVTGWFGAGKTTVIHQLADSAPGSIAVVQGGFGDDDLGRHHRVCTHLVVEEEVVELEAGCSCCALRLDLVDSLGRLATRRDRPSRVVVELTGEADATTVVQTALGDADLRRQVVIDGVVTVIDALDLARRVLGGDDPLLPAAAIDQVAVADHLVVTRTAALAPFAIDAALWTLRELNRSAPMTLDQPVDAHRILGLGAFSPPAVERRLVAERDLSSPPARQRVQQLAVTVPGELDADRFDAWLGDLHHRHGAELLRLHGVMAVRGEPCRWIASGARTVLEVTDGEAWADEGRWSRLRLIGRGLDVDELVGALRECVAA